MCLFIQVVLITSDLSFMMCSVDSFTEFDSHFQASDDESIEIVSFLGIICRKNTNKYFHVYMYTSIIFVS